MATIGEGLGWTLLFAVGTLRHNDRQGLRSMLPVVTSACHRTLQGRYWREFKAQHGYAGMIRTIEVNYGFRNGWHPHFQSLMFFRSTLDDVEVRALRDWWFSSWDRVATRAGYGALTSEGLDVTRLRSEDRIGEYLVKTAGDWGIGRELTRGDVKGSLATFPAFDLLQVATQSLWREYEAATHGRRFSQVSKGLRSELLGSVEEKSDQELAAAEGAGAVLFVVTVGGEEWSSYVTAGLVGWFLECVENAARLVVWLSRVMGHDVAPLEFERSERIDWSRSKTLRESEEIIELRSVEYA